MKIKSGFATKLAAKLLLASLCIGLVPAVTLAAPQGAPSAQAGNASLGNCSPRVFSFRSAVAQPVYSSLPQSIAP